MTNTTYPGNSGHAPTPENTSPSAGRTALVLLVLAYVLIYILPLGSRPMAVPDESRYGEIPREMLVTGNWIVPHLIDLRYFEKPPLGYWLNAISISLFGENNFAVRLPSALATGLTAGFIWLLLVRSGFGRRTAFAATMIYLSVAEVLIVGTLAVLDNPFTLFLSAGMILFYLAARAPDTSKQQRDYLLATGVLFGLAFLSKGFLAIALPGIVLLPYCLLQKRYKLLWRASGWTVLTTLLTVLPWAILIHLRDPDFWHYFIWIEHIHRFLAKDAQHAAPGYAYIMMLPGAMFPWLAFIPAAIAGFRLNKQYSDLFRYLLLWLIIPFVFFSISKGKLATYILPCMAPLAILVAVGVMNYLQEKRKKLFFLGVILNSLLLMIGLVMLLHNRYGNVSDPLYASDETLKVISMIAIIIIAIVLTIAAAFFTTPRNQIMSIAGSVVVMFLMLTVSLPTSVLIGKSPNALFDRVAPQITSDTLLVSDSNVVRAVAWVFKRTDIKLLFKGELAYGLSYPEHKDKFIGVPGLESLLAQQQDGKLKQDIAVFCENPCFTGSNKMLDPRGKHYSTEMYSVWLIPHKK